MNEGPILMNGAMVRAILAGNKVQTRRLVKPQPFDGFPHQGTIDFDGFLPHEDIAQWSAEAVGGGAFKTETQECPYGTVGDHLWVRETCQAEELDDGSDGVRYLADDTFAHIRAGAEEAEAWHKLFNYRGQQGAVVPSIHMPRWASRILLQITSVRVERLQDISEKDALAEGIDAHAAQTALSSIGIREIHGPVAEFSVLWESINGVDSWEANPWVWVVEFRSIKP